MTLYLLSTEGKELIITKINSDYKKIIEEINENSNIQIISKNKSQEEILNLLHEIHSKL